MRKHMKMKNTSPSRKQKNLNKKIKKTLEINRVVDSTQRVVDEVSTINKVISDTLYIKDNIAVDLRNFSLISVAGYKDIP